MRFSAFISAPGIAREILVIVTIILLLESVALGTFDDTDVKSVVFTATISGALAAIAGSTST